MAISLANEIVNLKTTSERTTYLSIGMFGLCQLEANGGIANTELLSLVSKLIDNSLLIGTDDSLSKQSEESPEEFYNNQK
ncbi:hypothetical protein RSO41_11410 [Halomonas sp. I1]|uniref:hypothetical protein n=1 Tax=Halomonas sp. I1 TaxID=393536 RepID=UPI0028DF86AA|nr:hypothetical protein [Halomonas sp. I1]MDT8895260.1 hypothetical protein [Halomonas sp. I1]